MPNLCTVPETPTREQIEAFRKEQHIPDDGKLEPWAIEENMVLKYLCDLASSPPAACDALALLRELNDALLPIPDALQARLDAILDRTDTGPDFNQERNAHADTIAAEHDSEREDRQPPQGEK